MSDKKMSASSTVLTPKCSLVMAQLGGGGESNNASASSNVTFKHSRKKLVASIAFTDRTLREHPTTKDVVLQADYKFNKLVTANGKYDAAAKVTTLGATWDGNVRHKAAQLKFWANNKEKKAYVDAKLSLNKDTTALLSFSQEKLLSAKYTVNKGAYTWEPSYNFVKEAPALAVTKRHGKDSFKGSYDFKSEQVTLEYARKPFKLTLSSKWAPDFNYAGKPSLTAVFENTYTI